MIRNTLFILLFLLCVKNYAEPIKDKRIIFNREPLLQVNFTQLPIGEIQPEGWLYNQLYLMRKGLTGHLDSLYSQVLGPRNGWLGGDGDGWERGPY